MVPRPGEDPGERPALLAGSLCWQREHGRAAPPAALSWSCSHTCTAARRGPQPWAAACPTWAFLWLGRWGTPGAAAVGVVSTLDFVPHEQMSHGNRLNVQRRRCSLNPKTPPLFPVWRTEGLLPAQQSPQALCCRSTPQECFIRRFLPFAIQAQPCGQSPHGVTPRLPYSSLRRVCLVPDTRSPGALPWETITMTSLPVSEVLMTVDPTNSPEETARGPGSGEASPVSWSLCLLLTKLASSGALGSWGWSLWFALPHGHRLCTCTG